MKYLFKNNKKYELEDAGRDGMLISRDILFTCSFENRVEMNDVKSNLEKWWQDNAPDELKEKYAVRLLEAPEVFSQSELNKFYSFFEAEAPRSTQLPLFKKDWRNRVKGLEGEHRGSYWWLATKHPSYKNYALEVGASGSLTETYAGDAGGVVILCYPKK